VIKKIVGENLKSLRTEYGINQQEIAHLLGITVSTVSRIERGRVALSTKHIQKLCDAYGLEYKYFFEDKSAEEEDNDSEEAPTDYSLFRELYHEVIIILNYILFKYGKYHRD